MASTVMSSLSLKPTTSFPIEKMGGARGLPSLSKATPFRIQASGAKKIKTDKPYGWLLNSFFLSSYPIISYPPYPMNFDLVA